MLVVFITISIRMVMMVMVMCCMCMLYTMYVGLLHVNAYLHPHHPQHPHHPLPHTTPTALSLLAADTHHTPLVNKENVLGRLVDAVARPDWSPRDTSLHALAQLARIDAAGQYAVVTAGAVPVVVRWGCIEWVCF